MNNGAGNIQNKTKNASTRGSKRPSSDVKLYTDDSKTALVSANTTSITTKEIAFDHAAKTGLWTRAGATDAESMSDRFVLSLLYTAKRAQGHTTDQPTQDALWALHYVYETVRHGWLAKVESQRDELANAKAEIQRLKEAAAWAQDTSPNANEIAEAVMTRVKPVIAHEFASRGGPGSQEAGKLDALHQRLSILDATVKSFSTTLDSVTATLASRPSYAAAAAADPATARNQYAGRPMIEQDAISRTEMKDKRILILASADSQNVWLENKLSEHIAKALHGVTEAFQAHPPPEPLANLADVTPRHAFRAGKAGLVLSFPSKAAADWVSSDAIHPTFIRHFQPDAHIRLRKFEVLLRNLPFSYDPAALDFAPALRDANSLPESWALEARWMKSVERRSNSQRTAHVILSFRTPEAANEVLDRGSLTVDNCVYRVERLLRDPPRCAQYQRHGHFADKCKNSFTCGNCAREGHHSNDCPTPNQPSCATCSLTSNENSDHPAWSRECPARLRALERLQRTFPEDYAPRFLTASNADTIMPRHSSPLASTMRHRVPGDASGARKHGKEADAPLNQKKKSQGAKTGSRPATPSGSVTGKPGRRSRAPSAASAASNTSNASKGTQRGAPRARRSSGSSIAVEAQLDEHSTADGTQ